MNDIDPATPPAGPRPPNRAVIIAFLVGGFALVSVSMVAQKFRNRAKREAPAIHIVGGDSASGTIPAAIRFVTKAPLANGIHGWSAGDLHPHALIDQQAIMPMGHDIESIAGDTFSLTLPALDPGIHRVRIYWADGAHRPVGDSARIVLNVTR